MLIHPAAFMLLPIKSPNGRTATGSRNETTGKTTQEHCSGKSCSLTFGDKFKSAASKLKAAKVFHSVQPFATSIISLSLALKE